MGENFRYLADALLQRYAKQAKQALATLEERATSLTMDALADAFVEFMLELEPHRGFTAALVDAHGGSAANREQFREAMRRGAYGILRTAIPRVPQANRK